METLWSVEDCASYLQRSRSWVYQMVAKGGLPCRSIGGLRFVPSEVKAWVEKQPRSGGSQIIRLRERSI